MLPDALLFSGDTVPDIFPAHNPWTFAREVISSEAVSHVFPQAYSREMPVPQQHFVFVLVIAPYVDGRVPDLQPVRVIRGHLKL